MTSNHATPATSNERPRIVAVDDEPDILRVLALALGDEGFEVRPVQHSPQAAQVIRQSQPAVVLLDLMMPELGGLEVLDQIRSFSAVPVIILTARGSNRDIVDGLDRGADDYVAKPFNLGELIARVRAVMRRARPEAPAALGSVQFGMLKVDFVRRVVMVGDTPVHLTRNEWRLLEQFVRKPGRVLSHEELLGSAWGAEFAQDVDYLRVWLSRLRRKLSDAGASPNLIRTASGVGYAFALEDDTVTSV